MQSAQDFFVGVAAFERGDYATALEHWQPMAEQGIAVAQNNLGVMYDHGLGVEEDDAQAVGWYRSCRAGQCAKSVQPRADVRQWTWRARGRPRRGQVVPAGC